MAAPDNKSGQSDYVLKEQLQHNTQYSRDDPPWLEGSEDSDEDEWFFHSIQRYKQLCTYSLICQPTSIDIHMLSRRLVVAGLRSSSTAVNVNGHEVQDIFEVKHND